MRTAETILNIIQDRGKRQLPLDDVKREKPLRAQFWSRLSTPLGGVCPLDDVGLSCRPGPTAVLPAVPSGMGQNGKQWLLLLQMNGKI